MKGLGGLWGQRNDGNDSRSKHGGEYLLPCRVRGKRWVQSKKCIRHWWRMYGWMDEGRRWLSQGDNRKRGRSGGSGSD